MAKKRCRHPREVLTLSKNGILYDGRSFQGAFRFSAEVLDGFRYFERFQVFTDTLAEAISCAIEHYKSFNVSV